MKKSDFKKGQTVYLKIIKGSNSARYILKANIENWIVESTVVAVGHKYITTNHTENKWMEEKFEIDNDFCHYVTVGSRNYKLFLSKQEIYDYIESEELYTSIKNRFLNWGNNKKCTLNQLQEINAILNQTEKENDE